MFNANLLSDFHFHGWPVPPPGRARKRGKAVLASLARFKLQIGVGIFILSAGLHPVPLHSYIRTMFWEVAGQENVRGRPSFQDVVSSRHRAG